MNFSRQLQEWYIHNRRDLPWRETKDPYFIWISEVILQQTRVQQGLPYYLRFIKGMYFDDKTDSEIFEFTISNEAKVILTILMITISFFIVYPTLLTNIVANISLI